MQISEKCSTFAVLSPFIYLCPKIAHRIKMTIKKMRRIPAYEQKSRSHAEYPYFNESGSRKDKRAALVKTQEGSRKNTRALHKKSEAVPRFWKVTS